MSHDMQILAAAGRESSAMVGLPAPRVTSPLAFRLATLADIPAIDALQKRYGKALGYFPLQQYEGYVKLGGILIAESAGTLAGFCISRDRYLKRDELGVIFQLCVVPGDQRKLVGAALVREVFARSAYGCKLYCCWCAQDLDANYFWESLGFLPIAFRAGSDKKQRVHIFWERRIREGDTGEKATPYWYPCNTNGGAIREDRLAFPIPPGVHWKDVTAVAMPEVARASLPSLADEKQKNSGKRSKAQKAPTLMPPTRRGARFGPPPADDVPEPVVADVEKQEHEKPKREKVKVDPALVAKARELRDRYLEHVNSDPNALLPQGKYEVARALSSTPRLRPEGSAVEGARALDRSAAAPPAALPAPMSAPMSSPMLADVSSPGELPAAA